MELKNIQCPYCGNITDAIQYDNIIAYNCCGIGKPNNESYYTQIDKYKSVKRQNELKDYKRFLLNNCNLPKRYIDLKFNTFPNSENHPRKNTILSACNWYIDNYNSNNKGKFITLFGYPSTGKTALSVIMMKYIINKINSIKFTCYFITENELINELVGYNQKQIYSKYLHYNLLCIDELGLNGKGNEKIFNVINDRYNKYKATILTTNIDIAKTEDIILYRIYERIAQKPNVMLLCNWEGLRLKG